MLTGGVLEGKSGRWERSQMSARRKRMTRRMKSGNPLLAGPGIRRLMLVQSQPPTLARSNAFAYRLRSNQMKKYYADYIVPTEVYHNFNDGQFSAVWSRKHEAGEAEETRPAYSAWRNDILQGWSDRHNEKVLVVDTDTGAMVRIEPRK